MITVVRLCEVAGCGEPAQSKQTKCRIHYNLDSRIRYATDSTYRQAKIACTRRYPRNAQKHRSAVMRLYNTRKQQNICIRCGKAPLVSFRERRDFPLCFEHYLKSKAGSVNKHCPLGPRVTWVELRDLWPSSPICPYLRKPMHIGDACIDHIIPISAGGTNDLHNLQWISEEANRAKGTMTHEQFIIELSTWFTCNV